jgi:hypothetical protein
VKHHDGDAEAVERLRVDRVEPEGAIAMLEREFGRAPQRRFADAGFSRRTDVEPHHIGRQREFFRVGAGRQTQGGEGGERPSASVRMISFETARALSDGGLSRAENALAAHANGLPPAALMLRCRVGV